MLENTAKNINILGEFCGKRDIIELTSEQLQEAYGIERADVMVLSDAYRPEIVAKDILGTWFVNDANGMHYLRKTNKGFANVISQNKTEKALTEFDGDYFTDYIQDGKWLINKKSLVVTDLMTGATKTLKDIDISKADIFELSPDGTKAVFAISGEENANGAVVQNVTYCVIDGSADPVIFTEPMLFSASSSFIWINENSNIMSARALEATGETVGSVIFVY